MRNYVTIVGRKSKIWGVTWVVTRGITCETQDQFVSTSQQRCEAAQKTGAFNEEITPVTIIGRKGKIWGVTRGATWVVTRGVTCETQDQFALMSQQRCEAAQKAGAFNEEITPVTIIGRKGKIWGVTRGATWVVTGGMTCEIQDQFVLTYSHRYTKEIPNLEYRPV